MTDDRSKSLDSIEVICRRHSLPVTAQRRVVIDVLASEPTHPTVDEIWARAHGVMPEISRTTVHRILETFTKLGAIRKVSHPGAAARYESRTTRHHHLVCLSCGRMDDLDDAALNNIRLPGAETGFAIEDYSILFRGLCSQCASLPEARRRQSSRGRRREAGRNQSNT